MTTTVANEVIIDEQRCFACGYCVQFCPKGCLEQDTEKIGWRGHALPVLTKPEQCNACGICVWMCPHWAITVNASSEERSKAVGAPRLAQEPPFAGCPGCQHPTVGRIIAEVADELGVEDKVVALDAIPCGISSAFGTDFGRQLAHDEDALDSATYTKRSSPDNIVIAVQGYWGLADFSFDISSFINTLIRGDKLTIVLCNTPYYGPKDGRPVPANEPVEGQLEPVTRINTPKGQQVINGGYPWHIAELVATFEGVAYSARGVVTSPQSYQQTKQYINGALQKQIDGVGLSFVEVLCTCCDPIYSAPIKCLKWIDEKMVTQFPLGEFKNANKP